MPTPVTRPPNYPLPFANSGAKNTIPTAATGTGKASFAEGFPAVTMLPLTAGGIPPEGKDFNGILYDVTAHTVWVNAGGQYRFDAALSTAIGGYPSGMVLQNNAGTASYVSAVDNNTTDFNSTPSSIGTLWLPWSGQSVPVGFSYINSAVMLKNGQFLVDSSAGGFTCQLPANPGLGTTIVLVDAKATWGSNTVTLGRNGKTIMGFSADLVLNVSDQQFTIWYNGSDWRLV